ncbi:IMV membrane protein [Squirrelpox virus]|uniref:IMV membrane protein n=1 Tax=Squirrelpox virus TaxID=240426 RepID=U3UBL9_9POXV|nr:IMV membrane protein [Squirrelpox virus]CCD83285.1 IMV membrane protein [Squirrelpox virus]
MELVRAIRTYYSGLLIAGIALLVAACVFAYVDFSRSKAVEYTWRALSIACFVGACVVMVGLILFVGYGRYCAGSAHESLMRGSRFNSTDIELNAK